MAEEEQQQDAEAAAGGSKKKLILIIVGALLLVGGSVGATLMLLGGDDNSAEAELEEEVELVRGDPNYIDLKPPFTVNLSPDDPVAFLQVSLQVLTFDEDVAAEVDKHKPLIRNNLVVLFGKQKSTELRAPEGKLRLQREVLESVQAVINQQGSGGAVETVFFTTFVMQ